MLQEIIYQEYESACEQSPSCVNTKGLEHVRCVRECMSPTCYQQIYYSDPVRNAVILFYISNVVIIYEIYVEFILYAFR